MNPLDLSRFEFCPRAAHYAREFEPLRLPIREALRAAFDDGIHAIRDGHSLSAATDFLSSAALRGFDYPIDADPYTLVNDCAMWLDGVLRIAAETFSPSTLYTTSASTWEQLLLGCEGGGALIHFPIPPIRSGRMRSVLTVAFRHPMTQHVRLATFNDESGFSPKWSPLWRWEHPEFTWEDWRAGIDADRCMGKVYTELAIPAIEGEEKESILRDAEAILAAIPLEHPRLRGVCDRCHFRSGCHDEDWDDYIRLPRM